VSESREVVAIYALLGPRTGAVRYIGKANDPAKRLKSHQRDARRRYTPVYAWLRELGQEGLCPTVEVLGRFDDWQAAERQAIARAREMGLDLLNMADGGNEPPAGRAGAAAGRAAAKARHPQLWALKKEMGQTLRWMEGRGVDASQLRASIAMLGAMPRERQIEVAVSLVKPRGGEAVRVCAREVAR
jgi:hypothetical protein